MQFIRRSLQGHYKVITRSCCVYKLMTSTCLQDTIINKKNWIVRVYVRPRPTVIIVHKQSHRMTNTKVHKNDHIYKTSKTCRSPRAQQLQQRSKKSLKCV